MRGPATAAALFPWFKFVRSVAERASKAQADAAYSAEWAALTGRGGGKNLTSGQSASGTTRGLREKARRGGPTKHRWPSWRVLVVREAAFRKEFAFMNPTPPSGSRNPRFLARDRNQVEGTGMHVPRVVARGGASPVQGGADLPTTRRYSKRFDAARRVRAERKVLDEDRASGTRRDRRMCSSGRGRGGTRNLAAARRTPCDPWSGDSASSWPTRCQRFRGDRRHAGRVEHHHSRRCRQLINVSMPLVIGCSASNSITGNHQRSCRGPPIHRRGRQRDEGLATVLTIPSRCRRSGLDLSLLQGPSTGCGSVFTAAASRRRMSWRSIAWSCQAS